MIRRILGRVSRKWETIVDAADNRIAQLAAISKGAGACETRRIEVAQEIINHARYLNTHTDDRRNKPVDVKRAWKDVVKGLGAPDHRPINPEYAKTITNFFEKAVRAGFADIDDLANCVGIKDKDLFRGTASMAASMAAHAAYVREKGLAARGQKPPR